MRLAPIPRWHSWCDEDWLKTGLTRYNPNIWTNNKERGSLIMKHNDTVKESHCNLHEIGYDGLDQTLCFETRGSGKLNESDDPQQGVHLSAKRVLILGCCDW